MGLGPHPTSKNTTAIPLIIAFTILWFWFSIPVVIVSSFLICRVLLWCITRCILCRFLPGLLICSGRRICFSFRSGSVIIFLTRRCTCFCSICRSEEHTSELQSRENLVCRLLLEKKKNI